jgi:hypothetical protein
MAECIPSIPVASAKAELEQDWKAPRSELPIVGYDAQASICVSSNPFGENNNPSQYSCYLGRWCPVRFRTPKGKGGHPLNSCVNSGVRLLFAIKRLHFG